MKTCVLCFFCAVALRAQVQIQAGEIPHETVTPQTVVAKIDGHDITLADIQRIMQTWPPQFTSTMQQNPIATLRQIYEMMYLGTEGEKRKLADEEPLKGQLAAMRAYMLAQAETSYERNNFPVSEDDINSYYEKNKAQYQQAKIKAIKLGLQEPIPLGSDAVQKAAQIAAQNARAPKRTEAEAKNLAADIIKKLRAGGDFAALAKQYSEDPDSKEKGGDYGTITPTSSYPDEMKSAILSLKVGEVSEPIRQPNALYVIRVETVTYQPLEKLHEDIINQIRNSHLSSIGTELGKRFTPELVHPEAFLPSSRPPSK